MPARSDRRVSAAASLNYGRLTPPACGCGQNSMSIAGPSCPEVAEEY
jgi:hypothetical protein